MRDKGGEGVCVISAPIPQVRVERLVTVGGLRGIVKAYLAYLGHLVMEIGVRVLSRQPGVLGLRVMKTLVLGGGVLPVTAECTGP